MSARLAILGLACGLVAGVLMLAFRLTIEGAQRVFLPDANPENYEALGALARVALPLGGALLIAVVFQWLPAAAREVGPAHVLAALERRRARLPLANAAAQWAGAAISIVAGHSVGREGPAIHLGAVVGSIAGQRLALPEEGLRVLVACGVAAAIAASFNTPLAGVVFAMEVVVAQYSVAGFAPVILAAVSATALTRPFYGADPAFHVPDLALRSLWELPYIALLGAAVGLLAAVFTATLAFFTSIGAAAVLACRLRGRRRGCRQRPCRARGHGDRL